MSIYMTGNTHHLEDIDKLKNDKDYMTKDDKLIVCGDFGARWYNSWKDNECMEYWKSKPYTVLFVDGNHENFTALEQYPVSEYCGGKVHFLADNVIHLMRGQVFTIEGKKFFTFGGGISIDKAYRTPYVSWWPQEEPSVKEMEEALANLEANNWTVDYVVTHAAPEQIVCGPLSQVKWLMCVNCSTEKFLDTIYDRLNFEMWFCGHAEKI